MTVPSWECKRGDDFYAPAPIVVKVAGVAQNLTDENWDIVIQGRPDANDGGDPITATWDTATELLEAGELFLVLDRAVTRAPRGKWYFDLQVTNDTLPKVRRKTSATWTITFVDTPTWTDDEVGS